MRMTFAARRQWTGGRRMLGGAAFALSVVAAAWACGDFGGQAPAPAPDVPAATADPEPRLANIVQLTFGGQNAEAYFSADGSQLVFQSTREDVPCDQIFRMNVDGSDLRMVSTGDGRTTCGYFYPDGDSIVYASTHRAGPDCPPPPSFEQGYVWAVYDSYDLFRASADGTGLEQLTDTPGYDAEATVGPDGRIVFTSVRDGDLEIYSMNGDGSGVRRLTHRPGPDGGPFFSPDGSKILFRGRALTEGPEFDDYTRLLAQGLWRPTQLEIFVMNADGSDLRQVTELGAASFAPFWHPDGERIIFSSNHHDAGGRNFDLFLIHEDGSGLEQITFNDTFDGFPMFSPDATRLVFASNRRGTVEGETNVFVAEWVE